MDGFKPVVKMKCGGSVSKAVEKCSGGRMKAGGKVMHDDVKEDKKMIKKAVNLHDDQLHEGKKTDLSTLKKGGRAKKETGTVRKFADGGLTNPALQTVLNADQLRKRKAMMAMKPGLGGPAAAAPSAPAAAPALPPDMGAGAGPAMPPGGMVPPMKRGGKAKK